MSSNRPFDADGYRGVNIVATIPGEGPAPQNVFVIGAHYDSEQNAGADDDASGIAALLEAVRVMRPHRFKGTLVFVAFDQEEERRNGWGRGSQFYANLAKKNGTRIQAMVGLDMVAYNHLGGNKATISRCDRSSASNSASAQTVRAHAFGVPRLLRTHGDAAERRRRERPVPLLPGGFPGAARE